MVIRRGRPAKAGERYPSGDLKRVERPRDERPRDERQHAVLPRMRELYRVAREYGAVAALALDPRMSPDYAPGQLHLLGQVSRSELEDGATIARIYGRFERLHGRRRDSASPDYHVGRRGRAEAADDEAAAIERDFALLRDSLMVHGPGAVAAVEQFWVEGRHVNAHELHYVLRITAAARRHCDKARRGRRGAAKGRTVDASPHAPTLPWKGRVGAQRRGGVTTYAQLHPTPPTSVSRRSTSLGDPPLPGEGAAAARTSRNIATHGKDPLHGKESWALLARTLFPELAAERIDAAWDALTALRERERFRRDKARRS